MRSGVHVGLIGLAFEFIRRYRVMALWRRERNSDQQRRPFCGSRTGSAPVRFVIRIIDGPLEDAARPWLYRHLRGFCRSQEQG